MAINKAINNTALLEMIPTGNVSVMNGDNGQSVNPVENGHPIGDKISIMELENCQNECSQGRRTKLTVERVKSQPQYRSSSVQNCLGKGLDYVRHFMKFLIPSTLNMTHLVRKKDAIILVGKDAGSINNNVP